VAGSIRLPSPTAIVPSTVQIPHGRVRAIMQGGAALGRWLRVAWDPQRFLAPYAQRFVLPRELSGSPTQALPPATASAQGAAPWMMSSSDVRLVGSKPVSLEVSKYFPVCRESGPQILRTFTPSSQPRRQNDKMKRLR